MNILCTDMDNTIIYSYKHDIGDDKMNVEIYQGREISYISKRTHTLLQRVKNEMLMIPTSTRTEEQYKRINLQIGAIQYALVCNGGVLLVDGKRDKEWYEESLRLMKESQATLEMAMKLLQGETNRTFDLRFIDDLFIFTKCNQPEIVVDSLKRKLDTECVNVFNNGEKVYVVPTKLSKGIAIKRLREKMKPQCIIAAGDSEFDLTMVEEADYGLVPEGFKELYQPQKHVIEMETGKLFSEALLERCLEITRNSCE